MTVGLTKGWIDTKTNGQKELSLAGHTHSYAASTHTHTKAQITDFPSSLPASDVYAWAKAASKPTYTYSEVGAAAASHSHSGYATTAYVDSKIGAVAGVIVEIPVTLSNAGPSSYGGQPATSSYTYTFNPGFTVYRYVFSINSTITVRLRGSNDNGGLGYNDASIAPVSGYELFTGSSYNASVSPQNNWSVSLNISLSNNKLQVSISGKTTAYATIQNISSFTITGKIYA